MSTIRSRLPLPDLIDRRYRVLARLGAGSFGVVLRAEDLFLHRPVALKVIEPSGDRQADDVAFGRFQKEAQALAQVRHENVVQVYAFGPLQGSYYLAMELIVGQPLEAILEDLARSGTTMPVDRALRILRAIAGGLEAVHAQKLVHRDVKPGNIILERATDRPVLIDFGLARRRSKSSPRMSITGGTPSYMAPEQARDPDGTRVSNRTDLYAFACTAFEVFTGRPVFESPDVYSTLVAHMAETPRRISTLIPALAPIDDVLLRALAKDPADRFGTIGEMMAALEAGVAKIGAAERAKRVLVLAGEPSLCRSVARNTAHALRGRERPVRCETAASASEALPLLASGGFDALVADEESAGGRLHELVETLRRARPAASVVVISRDFQATQRSVATRFLVPKPVNVHVLAAVLARIEI